jgi:hypothetical protein
MLRTKKGVLIKVLTKERFEAIKIYNLNRSMIVYDFMGALMISSEIDGTNYDFIEEDCSLVDSHDQWVMKYFSAGAQ